MDQNILCPNLDGKKAKTLRLLIFLRCGNKKTFLFITKKSARCWDLRHILSKSESSCKYVQTAKNLNALLERTLVELTRLSCKIL